MDKDILNAVARFERCFKYLLFILFVVILGAVVLRVWVLDVPDGVILPDVMAWIVLGICFVLSCMYLRIRFVMGRVVRGVDDGTAAKYRNDVVMKRRAADIGWGCLMGMVVLLLVFVFIMDRL